MGLEVFFEAFVHLTTERQIGMSVGPIPHSRVIAYAERYCLDVDYTVQMIRAMDVAYLERVNPKGAGGGDLSTGTSSKA